MNNANSGSSPNRRPCTLFEVERHYVPDKPAMLAALRVVLGLPKQLPDMGIGVRA